MPRKSKARHREPTPKEEGEQILEAAATAGTQYAQDQVGGTYFQDWVWEQMVEAERMRQHDPNSVIPLETPSDAKKLARNMLQQLEWDTKRDMQQQTILELSGAKGVFGIGNADWVKDKYGITYEEVSDAFFTAFDEALKDQNVRQWLADMVLEFDKEVRGGDEQEVGERLSAREGEAKIVSAKDLKPGDFVRGERGSRRYPILSVKRVGGSMPIEVCVQGQGTWHFKPDDSVEVFGQTLHETRRRPVVRDYIAVDNRGRQVAGPFADYGDAKAAATRARGFVKFASKFREPRRPR